MTYYKLLGLHPSASEQEIRQAYRELSRQYHPDTTQLPFAVAKQKFLQLNEAYATLSSQIRRNAYDQKIGYSRVTVVQPSADLNRPRLEYERPRSPASYSDLSDRPLSSGELFVLFAMGITLVGCLLLAIVVGVSRGDMALRPEFAREFGFEPSISTESQSNLKTTQVIPQDAARFDTVVVGKIR